jgi:hypothetical protein
VRDAGHGALHAFVTRLMRVHMVVLLSDVLEACAAHFFQEDGE